jgi:O-antigen/teichoic acid export membrane protein
MLAADRSASVAFGGASITAPAPARPASLGRNISYAALGNAAYACCQLLTMLVLVRLGSPTMVGEFALALAVTAPVIVFSQFNLRSVQATDARDEYGFGDYLTLRLVTTAAALLVIGSVAVLANHSRELSLVIGIIGLAKGCDSVTDTFFGRWQRDERLGAVSVVYSTNAIASLLALALALLLTGDIVWASVGFAAGSALALLTAILVHPHVAPGAVAVPSWRAPVLWRLASLSAPLGVVMLLVSLNASAPRYFVALHRGSYELGIFAAVSYVAIVGTTLIGAAGQSLAPRLAGLHAAGRTGEFFRLLNRFVCVCAAVGVAGVVGALILGEPLLRTVYSPDYARASSVLTVSMVGAALTYVASSLGYGMTASRQFGVQVPLFVTVCAMTAATAMLLVPAYGITGAAWAGAVGSATQVVGSVVVLRRAR